MPGHHAQYARVNKVFVRGLTAQNKTEAKAFFRSFGKVVTIKVVSGDGRGRGFGFVTFQTAEAAQLALEAAWSPSFTYEMYEPQARKTFSGSNTAKLLKQTSSLRNKRRVKFWRRRARIASVPCALADVLQAAPRLLDFLTPATRSAVSGCSRQLRQLIHATSKVVYMKNTLGISLLEQGDWSQLSLIQLQNQAHVSFFWLHCKKVQMLATLDVSLTPNEADLTTILIVRSQAAQRAAPSAMTLSIGALEYLQRPQLSQLKQLKLRDSTLSLEGIAQLTSISWPSLWRLSVCNNKLGAAGFAVLKTGVWPELLELDVTSSGLDAVAMAQLVQGSWPHLNTVHLSANPLSDPAAFAWLQMADWPSMAELYLEDVKLSESCIRELVRVRWPQLQTLSLAGAQLGSHGIAQLASAHWPYLNTLNLRDNALGADAMASLVQTPLPQLCKLWLSNNKLNTAAAKQLRNGNWPRLETLYVSSNYLDDAAMFYLSQGAWPHLYVVSINGNKVTALGVEWLSRSVWNLFFLDLDRTAMCEQTWKLLSLIPDAMPAKETLRPHEVVEAAREEVDMAADPNMLWPNLSVLSFHPYHKAVTRNANKAR